MACEGYVRPVPSPNGEYIAFSALGDIWRIPVAGGKPAPVAGGGGLDTDPSWSPDGKHLVFSSDRAGTMDLWVKTMASKAGREVRRLTEFPGAEFGPAWSPDGKAIAYLDERYNLWVIPAEQEESMAPVFDVAGKLARAGTRLVAGTDSSAVLPFGLSLVLEVEQLSETGLGPLRAIQSATQTAAEILGAEEELGTIKPGKSADMILLGGNPAEDIRNLRKVEAVILQGRRLSKKEIMSTPFAYPRN